MANDEEVIERLMGIVEQTYDSRKTVLGKDQLKNLEKLVVLSTLDEKWMDHLDEVENLREGIWLRGDKQTVLSEYKKEAFGLFENLIDSIDATIARRIFRVHPMEQPIQPVIPQDITLEKEDIHESITKEVADATPPSPTAQAPQKRTGSLGDLAAAMGTAKIGTTRRPGSKTAKIGRNDPCPCGSGLKYKKCGLINAPEHRG
jgi:preprotein translocase subunit SecA